MSFPDKIKLSTIPSEHSKQRAYLDEQVTLCNTQFQKSFGQIITPELLQTLQSFRYRYLIVAELMEEETEHTTDLKKLSDSLRKGYRRRYKLTNSDPNNLQFELCDDQVPEQSIDIHKPGQKLPASEIVPVLVNLPYDPEMFETVATEIAQNLHKITSDSEDT